ncbi:unnamed protein product, partial [Choristocarpus tenellus]
REGVKWTTLVGSAAMAWFCVITWMLGPALIVEPEHFPDPLVTNGLLVGVSTSSFTVGPEGGRVMGGAEPDALESLVQGDRSLVANTVHMEPLAPANQTLPKVDLLLTIFSGDDEEARAKRDLLRQIYDKYGGWVMVGGKHSKGTNKEYAEMSVQVVFLVSKSWAPMDGELIGDILYVNTPPGYRMIVLKTKRMMGLVKHFDFKYLLKGDDDTFVCLKRIATFLHDQPKHVQPKLYAGVPTACNLPTNPNDQAGGR